jgi:hypothetical protein
LGVVGTRAGEAEHVTGRGQPIAEKPKDEKPAGGGGGHSHGGMGGGDF